VTMAQIFYDIKTAVHGVYVKTAENYMGILTESKFLEQGVLTPDEFVLAGDLLVMKCPSWSWSSCEEKFRVDYLPPEKQFLITRKVPCLQRFHEASHVASKVVEDDWELTADLPQEEIISAIQEAVQNAESDSDSGEAIVADDFNPADGNLVEEDPAAAAVNNLQRTRTYDISLTYTKFFQTPQVWLFGYSENSTPLSGQEIFQDVSEDHAKKTVTMDTHPHYGVPCAFIHPCKHAHVMKKFVTRMQESGKEPRVDQYLLLFLKFLGAILPTINYDSTFELGF